MHPFNIFRSTVRTFGDKARARVEQVNPLPRLKRRLSSLGRVMIIHESTLCKAVAKAEGVQQASVHCADQKIMVDVTLSDGREIQGALIPRRAAFAPRGAKELIFSVDPPEAAQALAPVTAALSWSIARLLWPLQRDDVQDLPIVDSEGEGQLRVDLTTLPWLRRLLQQTSYAWLVELICLSSIEVHPHELHLRLSFPIFA